MSVDILEFQNHLAIIASDSALTETFRLNHPIIGDLIGDIFGLEARKPTVILSALPTLDEISALQFTLFDNFTGKAIANGRNANGRKTKACRWGGNLKAFTGRVDFARAPAYDANITFWPKGEVANRACDLQVNKKNPISDTTRDTAIVIAEEFGFVGIARYKSAPGDGTIYYQEHIVGMDIDGDVIRRAVVYSPNTGVVHLTNFAATDANGKRLAAKAIAQSRASDCVSMEGWATSALRAA